MAGKQTPKINDIGVVSIRNATHGGKGFPCIKAKAEQGEIVKFKLDNGVEYKGKVSAKLKDELLIEDIEQTGV